MTIIASIVTIEATVSTELLLSLKTKFTNCIVSSYSNIFSTVVLTIVNTYLKILPLHNEAALTEEKEDNCRNEAVEKRSKKELVAV